MATGSALDAQLGTADETTVGTEATPTHFWDFDNSALAFAPTFIEGQGIQSGRKFRSVNQAALARKSATGKIQVPVLRKGFGWWWRHFIGSQAVPQQIGAGSAYRQLHIPGNLFGVSFTTQVGKPETSTGIVKPFTYRGCKITDWTMTFADNANTLCDFTVDAWDEDTVTALAAASYPTGQVIYTFADVNTFTVGGTATTTAALVPPAAPVPTTAATGGTILAGTYGVEVTYINQWGETVGSASGSVTTTGSTSTITIPSPSAETGATGWYAYVTQLGGSTPTRQQTGAATAIGTPLTLTAPPTSTGVAPPTQNTSASSTTIAGASAIASVVTSLTLSGKNTLDTTRYGLGNAGIKKEQLETNFTEITGTFKGDFAESDWQASWVGDLTVPLQISSQGPVISGTDHYQLAFIMPACKITKAESVITGPGIVEVNGEFKVYDPDDGQNPAFQVQYVSVDTVR